MSKSFLKTLWPIFSFLILEIKHVHMITYNWLLIHLNFITSFTFRNFMGMYPSLTILNETKESHQHLSVLNSLSQVRSETSIVVNHHIDNTQFWSLSSIFTHPIKTPEPWVYFEMVKFNPHIFLCHGNESSVIQVASIRSLTGHQSLI